MASIQKYVLIVASPDDVWAAVRDVGNVHERLVPGLLTDCKLDGDTRIVTFANGMIVREPIIAIDDNEHRLAWAAVGGQFKHYNASLQVFDEGAGLTRLVWIADLLPNELATMVDDLMEQGLAIMKDTLEG
ncbi:Polyketide cyclase / dehydrase and lipid transport [Lysobacter dokdonensis DS-58]|uniref:Polyketide cyclase / dehydrase and lipid transport n=1 Tax=Lysobacter dokdonensis DS-58 TaxID=1300345 RepID=A0A0A2X3H3_9GAMM|nr:SRPBCC family protein [Lysobacter dokdonensis]KGQ19774.1 Polyketide cyclase / dehydrase and lipid transport [Lysobacter dokdonensis DS-58]